MVGTTQPLPQPHKKVGKYEIVEKIGEGGYSSVYRGFDPLIKRNVAIKSCSASDPEMRKRFYREAEIAGNLDHPNVVRVYDLFLHDDAPYLVQELLDGEDLDNLIERRELNSFGEKLFLLIQIARGLEYAHSRGVIHRDVKPANVRVLEDGSVKILDFGIAKLAHYNSNLTQKGMAVGTAAYLAPEQIRGEKATPATDIFSFGVLAYELLTFIRPFGRETISETFYQTLNHEPAPLTAHWSNCPPDLVDVISRCLHKSPDERFASCTEVLERLQEVRNRMQDEWAPEPNPARTQALPTGADLVLSPPTPTPSAAGHTQPTPIDIPIRERPSSPVDLPLRARPQGIRLAGSARRRRRIGPWLPLLALVAALAAAWLWLPREPMTALIDEWFPAASPAPAAAEAAPPAAAEQPQPQATDPDPAPPEEPLAVPATDAEAPASTLPVSAPKTASEPASLSFDGVWSPRIQLSVDGAPPVTLGSSRQLPVEPGAHSLTFSLEGDHYRTSQTLRVRVEAGESRRIPVPIAAPGRLTVQAHLGSPQGLVRIDTQRLLRPTPLRGQPIKPGQHRLSLFGHGDRSQPRLQTVVEIRSGYEAIVTFDLEGAQQPHLRERKIGR